MRGRAQQQPLPEVPALAPERAWAALPPPEGYAVQWRRLVDAALEVGLGPEEMLQTGLEPIAVARDWKPATVALYSKVARYGGVVVPTAPTPEPAPDVPDLRPLAEVRGEDAEHLRSVVWCAMALGWPAPVGAFRDLHRDQVHPTAHRLEVRTDDGAWSVPGALTAWHAWEAARARFPALAASPWVLPALRRGPGPSSHVGGRLSTQALQVTFTKHAALTAGHLRATAPPRRRDRAEALATVYTELSYDSFRRLVLAAGVEPVAPRGAVRAERAVRRAARAGLVARPRPGHPVPP